MKGIMLPRAQRQSADKPAGLFLGAKSYNPRGGIDFSVVCWALAPKGSATAAALLFLCH